MQIRIVFEAVRRILFPRILGSMPSRDKFFRPAMNGRATRPTSFGRRAHDDRVDYRQAPRFRKSVFIADLAKTLDRRSPNFCREDGLRTSRGEWRPGSASAERGGPFRPKRAATLIF